MDMGMEREGTGATGMGMLKRMKDMKDMVNAAPGMVAQGQELAAQAQQMAAAQQAAAQAQMAQYQAQAGLGQPGFPAAGPDFDPVAGVTLDQFAAISKGIAAYNHDQSRLAEVAASQGVDPVSWESASQGWNARIQASPAVAQRFNQLYRGA
jgi:hypothetical protein